MASAKLQQREEQILHKLAKLLKTEDATLREILEVLDKIASELDALRGLARTNFMGTELRK